MTEPAASQMAPYALELEPGQYWWCACGRSAKQPFCDGTHAGTGLGPVVFEIAEKKKVWLCGCRKSGNQPHCDGSHSKD